MHDFSKLKVWSHACVVARQVYEVTSRFPTDEMYGLSSQMKRSSVSVAANIAEGAARGTPREFARYLRIAAGSASELETEILIAAQVGLMSESASRQLVSLTREIRDMLFSLERTQKRA